ncbi:MAG: HAMP domain-containing protein [Oligoflexales bacterium]
MTTESRTRKSRNLSTILIEPFKQIKLGMYVITIAMTFVVLTAALFVSAFAEQYAHVMEIFNVVDPGFKWEVVTNDVFFKNVYRLGFLLVSFVAVLFFVVFRTTHKYYGPLISIDRFIEKIKDGDYTSRIVIRKTDELQDLANALNGMAETLAQRHGGRVGAMPERRKADKTSPKEVS